MQNREILIDHQKYAPDAQFSQLHFPVLLTGRLIQVSHCAMEDCLAVLPGARDGPIGRWGIGPQIADWVSPGAHGAVNPLGSSRQLIS
ncbi:hypothetical protein ACFXKC_53130 [Streptomyces sp. NPDC059340]|uniref:hypothetical protein n=1 Tax=Streptomyces sp. NPDC059340 TaxID=3346806 RepID=UPI00367F37F8